MATIEQESIKYLTYDNRVFLPSENINVFPCSRRGQSNTSINNITYYDPEARLNTERTNRIGSATNGFTESFIKSFVRDTEIYEDEVTGEDVERELNTGTLTFVLAGYHIEIKNFKPAEIAEVLAKVLGSETTNIYAHLGLHMGISLQVGGDYATEILYRQATGAGNYLDVQHSSGTGDSTITGDFFVGISFTSETLSYTSSSTVGKNLLLFTKSGEDWLLEQASLLPKIEHGTTEDSIKISGDFTVEHDSESEAEFTVTATRATLSVPTTLNNDLDITGTVRAATDKFVVTDTAANFAVPVTITGAASSTNGLTVNTADVGIEKNLKVGNPSTTIDLANTGSIVAKKDITAEQDLKAGRDISAGGSATIAKNLTVGTDNDSNTGVITAKKEVITPKLRVDTITSNSGSILVDDKKLLVTKSLEVLASKAIDEGDREKAAVATIDKAVIGELIVTDDDDLAESSGKITAKEMWLNDIGQVPALELAQVDDDTYQLRFKFGSTLAIKDERPQASEE